MFYISRKGINKGSNNGELEDFCVVHNRTFLENKYLLFPP